MKKRWIALVISLALVVGATGCGAESAKSSETIEESKEEERIRGESEVSDETESNEKTESVELTTEEEVDELKVASEAEIDGELIINVGDHQLDQFLWKIAKAKGFFEEEFTEDNISVEVVTFSGGPAIFEAVAAGGVQFGIGGLDPLINYAAGGADIITIAEFGINNHAYPFVVQKNSDITTVEELKGHKIAVTVGSYRHNALLTALESVGLTSNDVEIFNLSNSDILTAIQSGETDAAVISAPNYKAVEEYVDILTYAEEYKTSHNILVVDRAFAEKYPNTTARVVRVSKRTIDWIINNREEALEIFAEAIGADSPEKAESYYDTMNFGLTLDEETIKADIASTVEFDIANDILTTELDADNLIDSTYFKLAGIEP